MTSRNTTLGRAAHIGLAGLSAKSQRYTFERWVVPGDYAGCSQQPTSRLLRLSAYRDRKRQTGRGKCPYVWDRNQRIRLGTAASTSTALE